MYWKRKLTLGGKAQEENSGGKQEKEIDREKLTLTEKFEKEMGNEKRLIEKES